jgi:hypothetical protein
MNLEQSLPLLMSWGLTAYFAFMAGQIWESNRKDREARREAIERYKEEILREKRG